MGLEKTCGSETIAHMDAQESALREGFRQVFRRHAAGVTVITYSHDGELGGFTASSLISVAAEPPSVAFAVSTASLGFQALSQLDHFVVNFLDDAASELALCFAGRCGQRFAGDTYRLLESGEPVLHAASAYLRARIVARHEQGDSHVIVGELTGVHIRNPHAELRPLVYLNRSFRRLQP